VAGKTPKYVQKAGGGKFVVVSHITGKRLSKPESKAEAAKRVREIEIFKHMK